MKFAQIFIKNDKLFTKLDLSNNNVISYNQIFSEGFITLLRHIKTSQTIQTLKLDDNYFDEKEIFNSLSYFIGSNNIIRDLSL